MTERHGIKIVRVFDAPRERVWREWTEPEAFADWFGGTEAEVPISTVKMDVRVGGEWRATMFAGPSRHAIFWRGRFLEVDEPERLVLTISDQPGSDVWEILTVVLVDLGNGRTEMQFEQRGQLSPEQYRASEQGWGTFFARVEERLAGAGG
jgi:uncharacterized protein YndB with AHSA1/START domain